MTVWVLPTSMAEQHGGQRYGGVRLMSNAMSRPMSSTGALMVIWLVDTTSTPVAA